MGGGGVDRVVQGLRHHLLHRLQGGGGGGGEGRGVGGGVGGGRGVDGVVTVKEVKEGSGLGTTFTNYKSPEFHNLKSFIMMPLILFLAQIL